MALGQILIVQEDPDQAHRTRAILQCAKYDIPETASSAKEASAMAVNCRPDLVLMDIPSHNAAIGLDQARSLVAQFDIPVLCLMDCEDFGRMEQRVETDPIACLFKPYEDWELLNTVATALRLHKAFCSKTAALLRESEERFKLVFEHAPIGKALVGFDGRLMKVNKALCDLTGFHEDKLSGKKLLELFQPDEPYLDIVDRCTGYLSKIVPFAKWKGLANAGPARS